MNRAMADGVICGKAPSKGERRSISETVVFPSRSGEARRRRKKEAYARVRFLENIFANHSAAGVPQCGVPSVVKDATRRWPFKGEEM